MTEVQVRSIDGALHARANSSLEDLNADCLLFDFVVTQNQSGGPWVTLFVVKEQANTILPKGLATF